MASFDVEPLLDALSLPLGELIASVGRGVAEAQREMDAGSIAALQEIYARGDGLYLELQRIGYRPTWYHIPEAEGDLQIALTITGQETRGTNAANTIDGALRPRARIYAAPVDAAYAARFGFNVQASSRVKFRIVPVPPSSVAEAMQVVPALIGLSVADARARLAQFNIEAKFPAGAEDTDVVKTQAPPPGTLLSAGQAVAVGIA